MQDDTDLRCMHTYRSTNNQLYHLPLGRMQKGFMLLLLLTASLVSVFPGSLSYEPASGGLSGFNVHRGDGSSATPSTWENKDTVGIGSNAKEAWDNPGYIGRILYTGGPTNFRIDNFGTSKSGGTSVFCWDQITGTDKGFTGYYLVFRAKGLKHGDNSTHHKITNHKTVVTSGGFLAGSESAYWLPQGAGTDLAANGETGYASDGTSGTYNGSNKYVYKYPYRVIWIDVTMFHTVTDSQRKSRTSANHSWSGTRVWEGLSQVYTPYVGQYSTQFGITSTTDASLSAHLTLFGSYNQTTPSDPAYFMTITKKYHQPVPFATIESATASAPLEIGTISYTSLGGAAKIYFRDPAGGADFKFTNAQSSISYNLLFRSVVPSGSPVLISSPTTGFTSVASTIISPVGGETQQGQKLEGNLEIYLKPSDNPPFPGRYSTTISVHIVRNY